ATMRGETARAVPSPHLRAHQLLAEVWAAGLRDGPVARGLAVASYHLGLGGVRAYAEAALGDPGLEGHDRCDALFLLADDEARRGNYAEAARLLRQVTRLRRNPSDWSYLARCQRARGDEDGALGALEEAARIKPVLPQLHRELAEAYDRRGDRGRADWHRR